MIAAYNRAKVMWGVLCLLASGFCFALAWLFFRYSAVWLLSFADMATSWAPWVAALALAGICVSGHATWKGGRGFQSYAESGLYHDLAGACDTGVAHAADYYAHRVTGPAYVLSQLFLGGPLLLLRGITHLRQVVPHEAGLEAKLAHALRVLQTANKWQSLNDHPELRREILLLAQMKQIEFSAHKGTPRIKASPLDGA